MGTLERQWRDYLAFRREQCAQQGRTESAVWEAYTRALFYAGALGALKAIGAWAAQEPDEISIEDFEDFANGLIREIQEASFSESPG